MAVRRFPGVVSMRERSLGRATARGSTAGRMNLVASNIFRQSVVPLGTLFALSGLAGGCQAAELQVIISYILIAK